LSRIFYRITFALLYSTMCSALVFADIAFLYFVGLKSSAIEMKPYIDIVDSIKASSMAKFDGLI
ncbi:MAG: hypothetical protein VZR24_21165, partial [Butyrivibrio hungatei]|nr:hypothetical protein [Butyrivibrio hungatei]